MKIRGIVTTTVLILVLITISTTTAAAISCDCGDICANETGWWRDGGTLNASTIPIQAAVDNANAGETICVKAGSYTENVNITTPHLTLAGEGAGVVTVTAASSSDHVFDVTADYVNISGFYATGTTYSGKAGIYLGSNVDHCNISENNCSNNNYGINLNFSSNNTLANNTANSNYGYDDGYGIYLSSSSNNTLTNNTANSNWGPLEYGCGIRLYSSSNNTLLNNTANSNCGHIDGYGIYLSSSSNNTLTNNTANSNWGPLEYGCGIRLSSSSNNTLTNNTANSNYGYCGYGICLSSSSDNTLANNTANSNYGYDADGYGIWLYSSSNNTLTNNTANSNCGDGYGYGISLYSSSNNTLTNNTANSNCGYDGYGYGIWLYSSSNNTLTNNTANSNCGYCGYGIRLSSSSNNTLTNNTANSNYGYCGYYGYGYGISLYSSSNNTLTNNTANSNYGDYGCGIWLSSSSNNTLASNNCSNNTQWDIYIEGSDSTFTNNTLNGTTISFTYDGDVSLKGVGSPAADPAGQQTIGKFISATNQSADAWLFLNFSYSNADVSGLDEPNLAVWKHNGTMWLKDGWNGTRYLDTTGNVVGVNITSFSVFAPAAPKIGADYIPPDPTDLANTTGNYWVNYTWSAGTGGNATDSYNVSLNGTWTNETTDTFMNTLVGPSGWANITVFAYNASGTGKLSAGSVSDEVQAPAAPISCTCGDICANETGWWRDGGTLNASTIPIQAAVDNANAGETICVKAGSYTENVNITTPHLTLAGEGAGVVTVTAASSSDHVFDVTADYVNISGFYATGTTYSGKAGIYLGSNVDHCNISENNCSNNNYGIYLSSSSNNTLANNTANSNYGGEDGYGIYLSSSSNNTLLNNTANSNYGYIDGYGIYLSSSSNNTLTNNTANSNCGDYECGCGIRLYSSSDNTLANNTANSNHGDDGCGICLSSSSNNTLTNNTANSNYGGYGCGIRLYSSSDNTLANNTANSNCGDNGCGIRLYSSSDNTLANNTANSNCGGDGYGIYLSSSSNNTLTNNTANSNIGFDGCGIRLSSSSNNTLTNNTANSNYGDIYGYGIYLSSSSNNTLTNNTANSNCDGYYGYGIYLELSSNNTLANNTANSNCDGYYGYGIYLELSSNNTLANNTANSNYGYIDGCGIWLSSSSNNTLASNNCSNNTQWDIYVEGSDSTFTNNTLNGTTISFTYSGDVSLKGVGSPAADPAGQQTIGKFINATNQSADAWLFLNFSYSDADVSGLDEPNLTVWKHNGTMWLKDGWNGTRYLDTTGNVVGVNITSFSVFAPAAPKIGADYIPPDPTNLQNTIGEYWVNYTWSAGAGNVTDNYNVNLNGTWTNGTAETFMNVSVGPGGWANITVFAYNASGTGTLSAGSVSDEVQAPAAPPGNYVPPDPTDLRNTTGSYWVNYTWAAGTGINATDSYNVSLNGAWTNGTANTFMNTSVGPSGWANITVFAYNASGTGTLSAGSVSDEVQAPAAPPGNYVPPDPTNLRNTTGSYWVNYTWAAGTGINATDSYNVSLNGAWTNGTADTFANASVGQSGWANITVFAYNASGTGTLSAESVSDEVQAPAAPAPIVSYGESVHAKKNVRFAWRALGAPDGKGALMSRNARIAIELEDAIPDCEEVSIRVRKAGLRTPRFKVLVSSDGETWTQVGSASCSSSAWTRYDFTGDWSDVKYIAIQKPGTWRRPNLMGLDAVRAEGLS